MQDKINLQLTEQEIISLRNSVVFFENSFRYNISEGKLTDVEYRQISETIDRLDKLSERLGKARDRLMENRAKRLRRAMR